MVCGDGVWDGVWGWCVGMGCGDGVWGWSVRMLRQDGVRLVCGWDPIEVWLG